MEVEKISTTTEYRCLSVEDQEIFDGALEGFESIAYTPLLVCHKNEKEGRVCYYFKCLVSMPVIRVKQTVYIRIDKFQEMKPLVVEISRVELRF